MQFPMIEDILRAAGILPFGERAIGVTTVRIWIFTLQGVVCAITGVLLASCINACVVVDCGTRRAVRAR